MKRNLIIDGYNLMYQFPELRKWMERDLEAARSSLIDRLADHAEKTQTRITVVFDGDERTQDPFDSVPRVKVVFSQIPDTADHLIQDMIDDIDDPSEWGIVSSDNEIVDHARIRGIATAPSNSFAYNASETPSHESEKKYKHAMTEDELEEWMQLFKDGNQSG